jgi:16S rRNA (guanine527-N7)-methyltransferase
METVRKYFPDLTPEANERLAMLGELYRVWNERINVISRKDMEHFYTRHVLHSLAIASVFDFKSGTRILDIGTGGGFPGIPLAILFPETEFLLVDSIGKKIMVVNEVKDALGLANVKAKQERAEKLHESFDFVVSRAVTNLPAFVQIAGTRVARRGFNETPNGVLYLKGGDFEEELLQIRPWNHKVFNLSDLCAEPYFETKKLVYLSREPLS